MIKPTGQTMLSMTSYRLGVGLVILNRRNEIWMGRRRGARGNVLQMPQGGIDFKSECECITYMESPYEAAKRELFEETGLHRNLIWRNITIWLSYTFPYTHQHSKYEEPYIGQRQKWFLVSYTGTDEDVVLGDEFSSWCWMPRRKVVQHTIQFKQSLYIKIFNLFFNNAY